MIAKNLRFMGFFNTMWQVTDLPLKSSYQTPLTNSPSSIQPIVDEFSEVQTMSSSLATQGPTVVLSVINNYNTPPFSITKSVDAHLNSKP